MKHDVVKVEKPWGHELHWAKTERYVGKVLHVKAGYALSLQYHNIKDETIFLWTGRIVFESVPSASEICSPTTARPSAAAKACTSRRAPSTA